MPTPEPGSSAADITCQEVVELVTDYLEDALPAPQRERFEAHLDRCRGCRDYLGQMRRTVRLTGHLSADDVPAAPMERLLDAFRTWKAPPEE